MQPPEAEVCVTELRLATSFSLQESDGTIHTAEEFVRDVQIAIAALRGCTSLTIDARQARATLLGLMMSQSHELNVALVRDGALETFAPERGLELVPGVVAWLDDNAVQARPGIRLSTSGTTGKAKTAFHSLTRLLATIGHRTPSAKATWLLTYEPASFAGIQVLLTAAINGAKLLAPDRSINAMVTAARQGSTHVSATPSFWRALLAAIPVNISLPLKVVTLGGESCSQDLLDVLKCRFPGSAIRHIYASTEAGVGFTVSDGMAGFPVAWLHEGVQGVQLRIRDNELDIRTTRGMLAYVGDAVDPVDAGWLHTGDLVAIQNDRVVFQGRRDDVVNIGGTKVLPEKIEATLCGVDGVIDIAIVAHPNPILGFILIAQVCAAPGVDTAAVEATLKSKAAAILPPVARPARYRFVDSVTLSNGKKARKHAID